VEEFANQTHAGAAEIGVPGAPSFGARLVLTLGGLGLAIVLVSLALTHVGNVMTEPLAFEGVRLGLAPQDVRARFALAGTWTAVPGDELALAWSSSDPMATVRDARFEFHLGSLVAVRGHVTSKDEEARGDALRVSGVALIARRPRAGGDVDVLLVDRDCPTHAREVARLLGTR
jgi:hypothetical protein